MGHLYSFLGDGGRDGGGGGVEFELSWGGGNLRFLKLLGLGLIEETFTVPHDSLLIKSLFI